MTIIIIPLLIRYFYFQEYSTTIRLLTVIILFKKLGYMIINLFSDSEPRRIKKVLKILIITYYMMIDWLEDIRRF